MSLTPAQSRTRGKLHKVLTARLHQVNANSLSNYDRTRGICAFVDDGFEDAPNEEYGCAVGILSAGFRAWPKFSGNTVFPVPSPREPRSKKDEKYAPGNAWIDTHDKWAGNYGESRRELLEFLVNFTAKSNEENIHV